MKNGFVNIGGAFLALGLLGYAGGDIGTPVEPVVLIPVQDVEPVDNNFFIYGAGGLSWTSISDSSKCSRVNCSDVVHSDALKEEASIFELGAGYRYSENIFATIAAQRAMLEMLNIDNYYASINYRFSDMALKPFIGGLVGYSKLEWDKAPATSHKNYESTSDGLVYGVQAGVEFELTEDFTLLGKYQYLVLDHTTEIYNDIYNIKHDALQNILVGVRYEF